MRPRSSSADPETSSVPAEKEQYQHHCRTSGNAVAPGVHGACGDQGAEIKGKINPTQAGGSRLPRAAQATKAIASFLRHDRMNATEESITHENNNSVSFQTFILTAE